MAFKPSCLITKWGAIWLMQIATHERSHVQHPTEDCESKARPIPGAKPKPMH